MKKMLVLWSSQLEVIWSNVFSSDFLIIMSQLFNSEMSLYEKCFCSGCVVPRSMHLKLWIKLCLSLNQFASSSLAICNVRQNQKYFHIPWDVYSLSAVFTYILLNQTRRSYFNNKFNYISISIAVLCFMF